VANKKPETSVTAKELQEKVGISSSYAYAIINGSKTPSLRLALLINVKTEGRLSPEKFHPDIVLNNKFTRNVKVGSDEFK